MVKLKREKLVIVYACAHTRALGSWATKVHCPPLPHRVTLKASSCDTISLTSLPILRQIPNFVSSSPPQPFSPSSLPQHLQMQITTLQRSPNETTQRKKLLRRINFRKEGGWMNRNAPFLGGWIYSVFSNPLLFRQ